jgi:LytS/YehU family sensor histidine kinase
MPSDTKTQVQINNASGIGISVTKKRLDLLYPNRYFLKTSVEENFYKVNLKIKVK